MTSTTTAALDSTTETDTDTERADLLETLGKHRFFLRHTANGLSDDQARLTPTASALSLAGLIKHVTAVEKNWAEFIVDGPASMAEPDYENYANGFVMLADETLDGLLAEYEAVAARTDDLVASLPDLNASHPLPEAPWFEPGATWSARRTLLHIIAETAQHAGHADIIRETIDGQKTMG